MVPSASAFFAGVLTLLLLSPSPQFFCHHFGASRPARLQKFLPFFFGIDSIRWSALAQYLFLASLELGPGRVASLLYKPLTPGNRKVSPGSSFFSWCPLPYPHSTQPMGSFEEVFVFAPSFQDENLLSFFCRSNGRRTFELHFLLCLINHFSFLHSSPFFPKSPHSVGVSRDQDPTFPRFRLRPFLERCPLSTL